MIRPVLLDKRGRLTLPDVLLALFAVAFIGALWPVVADSIDARASGLSTGGEYLFQLLLPLTLLVLFSVIVIKAVEGGRS